MTALAEYMTLSDTIEALEQKLIDARIDINMKDARIEELERQLREARFQVRELEIGTQTMQTLALEGEEESFDPRSTGTFNSNAWKKNAR